MKAVVFDLDGTLLNTLGDIADSLNAVLVQRGLPAHPTEAYKRFVGGGAIDMIRLAAPDAEAKGHTFTQLLDAYADAYAIRQSNKTAPYEGIPELLQGLAERGIAVAVLSNKPHIATQAVVASYFPDTDFVAVFGQRTGIPIKPDPTGALEVLALMGLQGQEAFYVGDSDVDMLTANAAGMRGVAALWGYRGYEELAAAGAALFAEHPLDILQFL